MPSAFKAWKPNDHASVVLLHGFAQTERSWNVVSEELEQRTGRAVHAYAFAEAAATYEQACDALIKYLDSFETPPVVVGYSMGGRMALSALHCWEKQSSEKPLFSGLILESSGFGPASGAERESLRKRNAEWAEYALTQGVEEFAAMWGELALFASQKSLPEQVREGIYRERISHDAETLAAMLNAMGAHVMPDQDEVEAALGALLQIGVPVLYVAGSLDTKYSAVAQHLKTLFADEVGFRVAVIEGCGHNVHVERPHEFADVVVEFCAV